MDKLKIYKTRGRHRNGRRAKECFFFFFFHTTSTFHQGLQLRKLFMMSECNTTLSLHFGKAVKKLSSTLYFGVL